MRNQMRNHQKIIQVADTYLTLPSGCTISLDAVGSFTPTREFWELWRNFKMDVQRAGIGVRLEEKTGEWRGYVRGKDRGFSTRNFSYSKNNLHANWVEKARKKAETEPCDPVIIDYADLPRPRPKPACLCFSEFQVFATVCRNDTFQLRLRCTTCDAKTPNAIGWDRLGQDIVIDAIANAIHSTSKAEKERTSLFEELKGIDWV